MSIQTVVAFGIFGCIFCLLLRQYQRPQSVLLGLAVCCTVLLTAIPELKEIIDTASGFFARSSLAPECFSILCKAVGITYLTQLGVDFCRDCGETAIGTAVELCGRICLVALSLPLFITIADTVLEVME
jgi:stage III sporulation protein AD